MKHALKALVMLATAMLLAFLVPCLALAQPSERAGAVTEPALVGGGASAALDAQDATTFTVGLQVTYGQTEARSMLDSINAFRKGTDAWYWNETDTEKVQCSGLGDLAYDYDLERIAKYRAAEIALSYSHTTLDGTSPVWDRMTGRTAKGENIAAGYTTAAAVFEGWQETNDPYSGQGHRRNMLSANFTAVGIGHVVCNGYHYWVQEFGAPTSNAAATDADDFASTVNLQIVDSVITARSASASPSTLELAAGESADLPGVAVKVATADTWPETLQQAGVQVSVPGITWSSSDPSVAKVADGSVEAVAAGTATLTATVPLGSIDSPTVAVTVTDPRQPAYAIQYKNGDLVFQEGSAADGGEGHTEADVVQKVSDVVWAAAYRPWVDELEENTADQVKRAYVRGTVRPANMKYLFSGFSNLESVDLTGFDCTNVASMAHMFNRCWSLKSIDLSQLANTGNVTDMSYLLQGCSSLESITLKNGDRVFDMSGATNVEHFFLECSKVKTIDLSSVNLSAAKNAVGMFNHCASLEAINLEGMKGAKLTGASNMFSYCSALKNVDLSCVDTSAVKNLNSMFHNCTSLSEAAVYDIKTDSATSVSWMFCGCQSFKSFDFSRFNMENVTKMDSFLSTCPEITELDLTKLNAANIEDMGGLFYSMYHLKKITLGPNFKFVTIHAGYNTKAEPTTGTWKNAAGKEFSPSELAAQFNADPAGMAGVYTRDSMPINSLNVNNMSASYSYTGSPVKPQLVYVLEGSYLHEGKDIEVTYENNVNPGTATMTVHGIGFFSGTRTFDFEIQDTGEDLAPYAGKAKAAGFADLDDGEWYMKTEGGAFPGTATLYLDYTVARGLMSGYTGARAGQFGPNDTLSRGMAATIIYRMATGATAESTDNEVDTRFPDVKRGAWYAAAVEWCAAEGVVTGYTDGSDCFGPDDPITREQLATIIGRYMDKGKEAGEDVSQFKDEKSISGYAKAGIAYCSANGIMTGVGDTGNFDPKGFATRCQMSKVIAVTARKAE